MSVEKTYENDRTRAIVDLDAIRNNYTVIRKTFPGQLVMSVLKADAYGHGIRGIAAVCDERTDWFAVATVEEGERLREAGAKKPVLLFGPVPEGCITEAARLGLTFSVGSMAYAMKLRAALVAEGLTADCHIKIDTGFNRTGFRFRESGAPEDAAGRAESFSPSASGMMVQQILMISRMKELNIKGVYTHLPVPESDFCEDVEFTKTQIDRLQEAVRRLREAGLEPGVVHAFSTGGALHWKGTEAEDLVCRFDMIRVGMMVYGQCDTAEHYKELGLKQAMTWSANVIDVVDIAEGETVGYGRTFAAQRPTTLGVVSVGYADGYRRNYQGLTVLCGGKRVPIIGRICMDFLMIDLTDVEDPGIGMEVILLGSQEGEEGAEEITAIDIADARQSTCGEVTAAINERVPRYYVDRGRC